MMDTSKNDLHNDRAAPLPSSTRPLFYAQAGLISLQSSARAQRRQEGTWVDEPGWTPLRHAPETHLPPPPLQPISERDVASSSPIIEDHRRTISEEKSTQEEAASLSAFAACAGLVSNQRIVSSQPSYSQYFSRDSMLSLQSSPVGLPQGLAHGFRQLLARRQPEPSSKKQEEVLPSRTSKMRLNKKP